jgi:hypothetical protein
MALTRYYKIQNDVSQCLIGKILLRVFAQQDETGQEIRLLHRTRCEACYSRLTKSSSAVVGKEDKKVLKKNTESESKLNADLLFALGSSNVQLSTSSLNNSVREVVHHFHAA